MTCNHRQKVATDRPYFGPVSRDQNPRAHGWACREEVCSTCGATRRTNYNGPHEERGAWRMMKEEE